MQTLEATETLTTGQIAARKAWITMRAQRAILDDVAGNFQDCAGCGKPTKVGGPRGRTFHAECAERAGVSMGSRWAMGRTA